MIVKTSPSDEMRKAAVHTHETNAASAAARGATCWRIPRNNIGNSGGIRITALALTAIKLRHKQTIADIFNTISQV